MLGLKIAFVRADAACLDALPDGQFDLVTSTNGFFVWIADPGAVYSEVHRILRNGGFYVFYDIHPFQRPWEQERGIFKMRKPYGQRGPFTSAEGGSYEFHWTLSDLVNPLVRCGFRLCQVEESSPRSARFFQDASYEAPAGVADAMPDWRQNTLAGLPTWLTIAAQKLEAITARRSAEK